MVETGRLRVVSFFFGCGRRVVLRDLLVLTGAFARVNVGFFLYDTTDDALRLAFDVGLAATLVGSFFRASVLVFLVVRIGLP